MVRDGSGGCRCLNYHRATPREQPADTIVSGTAPAASGQGGIGSEGAHLPFRNSPSGERHRHELSLIVP